MPGRCNWRNVSRENPCRICGRPDWCSISADGRLAACRRVEAGCWRTKIDRAGAPVYLHRLDGSARCDAAAPPRPRGPEVPRANPDTLHAVYSALLARLPLSGAHREALRARGLADEVIDRNEYRTLPIRGRARIARELRERFGDALLQVPGFIVKPGTDGQPYVTIAGWAGLLVPVRDTAGRIVALQVRRNDGGDGPRYSYLSSYKPAAGHYGPSPGTPAHVPLGVTAPCPTCRLTEGALKADVATALSGLPTIGAAGTVWRPALDRLNELGCQTVRLAFDADARQKPAVARALLACSEALAAEGLAVELERWPLEAGKGIDDLLAAGGIPEILAGDAARQAIREIATDVGVKAEGPAAALDRLADVLATGGAAALFADRPLLEALARLADTAPAAFAACRATLKGSVNLRDLDAALKPLRRELARERPPLLLAEAGYRIAGGRLCRERGTPDGGTALVPLANFTARITEVITRDDGTEQTSLFTVAGALPDGRELPPVQVAATDFAGLSWVTSAWHGEAVVYAGQGTRDHVRAAIELVSEGRTRRTIYTHTGWREVAGAWHYLHAGGAIGPEGAAAAVSVALPENLAGFELPDPPTGADLVAAVRASLALLDGLAPDPIAFALLGAVYRAPLGPCDFSVFLAGDTGQFKSELAALCQQHFGAGLVRLQLPANWSWTANALESLAFAAKDVLLVVDDFAPKGNPHKRQEYHAAADRLFRGQGNHAGRGRLSRDGRPRPGRPPRGLIQATGEEIPDGQSLRARLLILEIGQGDVNVVRLTACQQAAAAGLYARALAGYVRWLARRYGEVKAELPGRSAELRALMLKDAAHARTPGVVADLLLGLQAFLDFACITGAIPAAERDALRQRGCRALQEAGARQAEHVQAAEPTAHFLGLLAGALASGRAHLADPDGREPEAPAAWGWRREDTHDGPAWRPQGRRIGWIDGADLYLEPEASYAAAQELAGDQGEALPIAPRTLWQRLRERRLLASWGERRQRNTVRRTLEAVKDRKVLHLRAEVLSPCGEPSEPSADSSDPPLSAAKRTVSADGPADGNVVGGGNRPQEPSAKPAGNRTRGRFGRSNMGGGHLPAPEDGDGHGDAREGDSR